MKTLFLLLFLALTLFANEKSVLQAQILEKIFQNISIKEEIVLWSDNKNLLQEFAKNRHFHTTNDCDKATLLILEDKKNLPKSVCQKAIFVLEYALLKEIPQSFGAMFWKKGRPNIVLIESRMQTHSIQIGKGLEMYVEEKIW
jgi:hypothetical protein